MAWTPIRLRFRSGLVAFDGEAEGAGGGPVPFTPTSLSGLALWLDASDAATINAGSPSDDDPVSAWADKSTNGYDAAQADSDSQPVYKAAIENDLAVVRFGQPPDYTTPAFVALSGTGLGLFQALDGFTVACAYRGVAADDYLFVAASGSDAAKSRVFIETNAPQFRFSVSNADATDAQSAAEASRTSNSPNGDFTESSFAVAAGACDLLGGKIGVTCPNTFETANSSTFPSYAQFAATPGPTPNTPSLAIRVGAGLDGMSPFSGDIGELLVYDRMLTAGERRQVLEYLSNKWATL